MSRPSTSVTVQDEYEHIGMDTSPFAWSPEMEENVPQPQIKTRWYSSLVYALGPDAPWLRHVNRVTMAADGECSRGPQFGSQPNNLYHKSHEGGVTSETDGETPVETVEKLLGDAPIVASSSTPSSTDVASFFDDMGTCKLRKLDDIAYLCGTFHVSHYGRHLMYGHIFDELARIRSGKLEVDHAELLVSHERVRRAERYEWVCPMPECTMASMRRYEVERHIYQVHDSRILTLLQRKGSRLKYKTLADAVMDILGEDGGEITDSIDVDDSDLEDHIRSDQDHVA